LSLSHIFFSNLLFRLKFDSRLFERFLMSLPATHEIVFTSKRGNEPSVLVLRLRDCRLRGLAPAATAAKEVKPLSNKKRGRGMPSAPRRDHPANPGR
jgi:hypothetical protein